MLVYIVCMTKQTKQTEVDVQTLTQTEREVLAALEIALLNGFNTVAV